MLTVLSFCLPNFFFSFATIAGIAFGSFFFIVIVIICVYCYFFKKAGSARGIGFFGSTGTTTVVTRGPVTTQNTGKECTGFLIMLCSMVLSVSEVDNI